MTQSELEPVEWARYVDLPTGFLTNGATGPDNTLVRALICGNGALSVDDSRPLNCDKMMQI